LTEPILRPSPAKSIIKCRRFVIKYHTPLRRFRASPLRRFTASPLRWLRFRN